MQPANSQVSSEVRRDIYIRSLLISYTNEGPGENVNSFPTLNGHDWSKFPPLQELAEKVGRKSGYT